MLSAREKEVVRKDSERGFVLLIALVGIMILMVLGFFALTTVTDDLRIAARIAGERKAFSAAESGVHHLCLTLDALKPEALPNTNVDAVNDPGVLYSYAKPEQSTSMPFVEVPGYDLVASYKGAHFDTIVTGEDTNYGSKVQIAVGTVSRPGVTDLQQGPN